MTEFAIRMDEVFGFDAGAGAAGVKLFRSGLAIGAESAGQAGGASAGGFETGEECLPVGIDRSGIGLVLLK